VDIDAASAGRTLVVTMIADWDDEAHPYQAFEAVLTVTGQTEDIPASRPSFRPGLLR
jgi:hypothetical protein